MDRSCHRSHGLLFHFLHLHHLLQTERIMNSFLIHGLKFVTLNCSLKAVAKGKKMNPFHVSTCIRLLFDSLSSHTHRETLLLLPWSTSPLMFMDIYIWRVHLSKASDRTWKEEKWTEGGGGYVSFRTTHVLLVTPLPNSHWLRLMTGKGEKLKYRTDFLSQTLC